MRMRQDRFSSSGAEWDTNSSGQVEEGEAEKRRREKGHGRDFFAKKSHGRARLCKRGLRGSIGFVRFESIHKVFRERSRGVICCFCAELEKFFFFFFFYFPNLLMRQILIPKPKGGGGESVGRTNDKREMLRTRKRSSEKIEWMFGRDIWIE